MAEFDRVYDSPEVMAQRYAIFQANMAEAAELNREEPTAEYGVTRFSDLSPAEFEATYLTVFPDESQKTLEAGTYTVRAARSSLVAPPNAVDWREKLNDIKDQKSCGSCWAFSAMSAVEGAIVANSDEIIDGSEQALVDCDELSGGCQGGWMHSGIAAAARDTIKSQASYPYKAKNGKCHLDDTETIAEISAVNVRCANSPYVPPEIKTDDCKDDDTRAAVAEKVQSIAINAKTMMSYRGGIMDPSEKKCKPKQLNHGVDIVGYGEEDGVSYYLGRNSWGKRWGEKGYFRIISDKNACGINAYQVEANV
eukprot:TRINITY_DN1096_c1_g2_i1.p1 TRINITY_DN1096_c1_g2~~TRINITY_DN1096_c1_g2_i1.p1  ORF type:complete len:355 (-),score=64.33 TRINITY_DN1096_c1_g2_i1:170-1096(-)